MKPDWEDAPEWANWLAMDEDGVWFWHEHMPRLKNGRWLSDHFLLVFTEPNLGPTVEARPQP